MHKQEYTDNENDQ